MTAKIVNYTAEQTAAIVADYRAGETVEQIADRIGKSVRSVVAKLSREGEYKAKGKAPGAGRAVTKAAMLTTVEELLGMEAGVLDSLAKGDKEAILALLAAVTNRVN